MLERSAKTFKTRKRLEFPGQLRYLTFSCYHRLQLFANPRIRDAFVESLERNRAQLNFKLVGWVVMPEHVHLMIVPALPGTSVSDILERLKSHHANRVLRRWRSLRAAILPQITDRRGKPHFWQLGGGQDRNIVSMKEYEQKLNYVHNNPVKRNLVLRSFDWKWSSARWYAGMKDDVAIDVDPWGG